METKPEEVLGSPNEQIGEKLNEQIIDLNNYNTTGYIPEPPPIIDETILLNALGEETLSSLGLASNFTPVGWIQSIIEYLHVGLDLPWFQAIIVYGIIMRLVLFPITIKTQKNAAKMRKTGPINAKLREKLNDAKMSGDSLKGFDSLKENI